MAAARNSQIHLTDGDARGWRTRDVQQAHFQAVPDLVLARVQGAHDVRLGDDLGDAVRAVKERDAVVYRRRAAAIRHPLPRRVQQARVHELPQRYPRLHASRGLDGAVRTRPGPGTRAVRGRHECLGRSVMRCETLRPPRAASVLGRATGHRRERSGTGWLVQVTGFALLRCSRVGGV